MKVWELEEGVEYVLDTRFSFPSNMTWRYKLVNGTLYHITDKNCWEKSIVQYNYISALDFVEYKTSDSFKVISSEKDTRILVSQDGESWVRRHYSHHANDLFYVWENGRTSFTARVGELENYRFAKLYVEGWGEQ